MANNFHHLLKFTHLLSKQEITFLDTTVYKGKKVHKLQNTAYQNPHQTNGDVSIPPPNIVPPSLSLLWIHKRNSHLKNLHQLRPWQLKGSPRQLQNKTKWGRGRRRKKYKVEHKTKSPAQNKAKASELHPWRLELEICPSRLRCGHPYRLYWWHTTLMRDHTDERPSCWHTTVMRDHPDDILQWWETIMTRNHPDDMLHWWQTTLMTDHTD